MTEIETTGPTITLSTFAETEAGDFFPFAALQNPESGELLPLMQSESNPFTFRVIGEKMIAEFCILPVFSAAATHVERKVMS